MVDTFKSPIFINPFFVRKGNCNGTNLLSNRYPSCDKDGCVEGMYNSRGKCQNCSSGCLKCTYEVDEMGIGREICQECEKNQYTLTSSGSCLECSMPDCYQCHYEKEGNETKPVCDKCYNGYYLNSDGECAYCNLTYCSECHPFDKDDDTEKICDKCLDGYFLDSKGNCEQCKEQNITAGMCL